VLPSTIQTPPAEIVIRGLPSWELVREQPPGTAPPHDVENRIQDFADLMESGPAHWFGRWQKRVKAGKLSVRKISQVRSPQSQTPAIVPAKPTRVPVFRQSLVRVRSSFPR